MFDLDEFKHFNDAYGHQAGDECLRQVATALRDVLRRAGDLVARYGGEEFAAVLPESDLKGALQYADAARLAVENLAITHGSSPVAPVVTVSVGVASALPRRGGSPTELIARADQALYQAKRKGKNRVESAGD
jgi:diguanylate cyclase (GGDEF)-like protein